ncbi:uncharacterized protein JCM15063_005941 [Sporobolomyces koalae]|uniref:uncharacterized protein n=1 Tax=Sporobolomyces koalae TaxID=500713 RepID=UPI00316BC4AE
MSRDGVEKHSLRRHRKRSDSTSPSSTSSSESESDPSRSNRSRRSNNAHHSSDRSLRRHRKRSDSTSSDSTSSRSSSSPSSHHSRSSSERDHSEDSDVEKGRGDRDEAATCFESGKVWLAVFFLVVTAAILLWYATNLEPRTRVDPDDEADGPIDDVSSGSTTPSSGTTSGSSASSGINSGSSTTSNRGPSDFVASLASSLSMTPASVTTLPAPTATLANLDPAAEFISSKWPVSKFSSSEFVSFVKDPFEQSGQNVLSVEYPEGSYSASKGGASMRLNVFGTGKMRALLSYEVGFESNFDFVQGGKLAGLFGGDAGSGCTGGKGSEACFSARFMWRAEGKGEVYGYVPTYEGQCTKDTNANNSVICHDNFGQSFDRGSFTFETGKWNRITEIAILNSDPSQVTEADGQLAVYFGDSKAFERTDIVFRTNSSVFFSSVLFQTFFGGSTEEYASPVLTHTYYRNWLFYEGDEASAAAGKKVHASISN